ncbi:hypothetical protein B0H11DRAFT_2193169, partial [Mycena galericulata]
MSSTSLRSCSRASSELRVLDVDGVRKETTSSGRKRRQQMDCVLIPPLPYQRARTKPPSALRTMSDGSSSLEDGLNDASARNERVGGVEWVTPNESERKTAVPASTASAAPVPTSQTFVPPINLPIPALSTAPGGQNTFPPCPQDAVAHFHPHLDGLGTAPIVLRADYPKCQDGCCGSSTITRGPTAVRPTPTPAVVLEEASTAVLTPVPVVELGNTDGTGNLNAGFDLGDLRGKSDDGERIRLTDFAIAKAISEALGALGISTVMAIPLQPVSHPVSFPAVHVIHPSSGGA